MPSPFPGMDPYLEHPVLWAGVHDHLIIRLRADLNARLPKHYVANIQERVYVEQSHRDIYPDVFVKRKRRRSAKLCAGNGVALAEAPWQLELAPHDVHEPLIEILDVMDKKRVVTVIEVLSPANKTEADEGLYVRKQREVLKRKTHLIEIDLLRRGKHTVAVPENRLKRRGTWDYLVCLSRGDHRERREVWPILLPERLPRILVPLAGKDPDVIVDLQPLMDEVYDEGGYGRQLDYRRQPVVRLERKQQEWADKLLRKRGLRP